MGSKAPVRLNMKHQFTSSEWNSGDLVTYVAFIDFVLGMRDESSTTITITAIFT